MPEIAGDAGLVVPPGDGAAFAETVARLVADTALRDELRDRARRMGGPDNEALIRQVGFVYDGVTA
jgi:glycosyltransferase involved in cell wall biosynthesis